MNPTVDFHALFQFAQKWLPSMISVTIKTILVLMAAGAATRFLRRRDASIRHIISLAALYGILVIPLAPGWNIPINWPQFSWTASSDIGSSLSKDSSLTGIPLTGELTDGEILKGNKASRTTPQNSQFQWIASILFLIWTAGILILLIRFIPPYFILLLKIRRTAFSNRRITAEVDGLAHSLNFRRPVSIVLSKIEQSPLTFGLFHPLIVLPPESIRWPLDFRRSVILHELAHAARYDVPTRFIAQLLCIFFWFNPLIWQTLNRLIRDSECASDEWVLKTGIPISLYAEHLLKAGAQQPMQPISILGSAYLAKKSDFKQRLVNLVNHSNRRPLPRRMTYLLIFTTLLAWLPVAGIRISPKNTPADTVGSFPFLSLPPIPSFSQTETLRSDNPEREKTSIPSIWPLDQPDSRKINSGIGIRIHPLTRERALHMGVDIKAEKGTAVLAAADGIVKQSRFNPQLGHVLVINHPAGYSTSYFHLDSRLVSPGKQVKQGDVIGRAGDTGTSIGTHLHYEVHHYGLVMDPEDFFPLPYTVKTSTRVDKKPTPKQKRETHE